MIIEDERLRRGPADNVVRIHGEMAVVPFYVTKTAVRSRDGSIVAGSAGNMPIDRVLDAFVTKAAGRPDRCAELAAAKLVRTVAIGAYKPPSIAIGALCVRCPNGVRLKIGRHSMPVRNLLYENLLTPRPTFAAVVTDCRNGVDTVIASSGPTEAAALKSLLLVAQTYLPIEEHGSLRAASMLIDANEDDERGDELHIDNLIEDAYEARDEIVLCLMGAPGIGKTEAVEKFAKRKGVRIVHKILSQVLPSETSGIAMPDRETKSMEVFDDAALASMEDGDILFLDELLKAQQPVLNACLTLVQERRLTSGRKLPDVMIVAAANPLASPTQLPLEIRQRFMFVDVPFSQGGWLAYMDSKGFPNADWLLDDLNVTGRSSEWNCLTPRTATKLCQWMRRTGNSQSVTKYVTDVFGSDVASHLLKAVAAEKEKSDDAKAAEAMLHVASRVMAEKGDADAPSLKRFEEVVLGEEDDVDLDKLVGILKDEGIWDQVAAGLSNITL